MLYYWGKDTINLLYLKLNCSYIAQTYYYHWKVEKLLIILDTIAFNTYLDLKKGREIKNQSHIDLNKFETFVDEYKSFKYVHSATILELFVKHLKSKDPKAAENFIEDYNEVPRNNMKLCNEEDAKFDWQRINNLLQHSTEVTLDFVLENKVKIEVEKISMYFAYITLVVGEILFDIYGDEINERMYEEFHYGLKIALDEVIKITLENYYLNKDVRKEAITKQLDHLLAVIIIKTEDVIKNKDEYGESYLKNRELALKEIFKDVDEILNNKYSGVNKAREILISNKYKGPNLKQLIHDKIDELDQLSAIKNRRTLTVVEKEYLLELINQALQLGTKITKNDFIDCMIVSSLDLLDKNDNDYYLITFDKKLVNFMKTNGFYYNSEFYSKCYKEPL